MCQLVSESFVSAKIMYTVHRMPTIYFITHVTLNLNLIVISCRLDNGQLGLNGHLNLVQLGG